MNIWPTLLITTIFTATTATAGASLGHLSISVTSAKNDQGNIEVHLLNTLQQFNSEAAAFLHCKKNIKQKKVLCEFPLLPFGNYAVYAFHDENLNGQLDVNIFGVPSEKLAISGVDLAENPEPSYQQSLFLFHSQDGQIFINLQ